MSKHITPFGVLLAVVWLALFPACRGLEDRTTGESTAVKIQLDWRPGAEHAFLYAGKAKGYFDEEGIALEIVPGTGSSDSVNMVDAKTVDFALASGETALQGWGAETPRRTAALAVFYPTTPTVIYSMEEKGIVNPEDLYGKRLGVLRGSSAFRNYEAFAAKIGLDRSLIREIPSTGDLREMIGDDAPLDAMVHFGFQHPLQLELEGQKVNVIRLRDFGIRIYGQSLITARDMLTVRPELVRRVVRAVQRSYLLALANPDETLRVYLAEVPGQDEEYADAKLKWVNDFVRSGIPAGEPIGYQDRQGWEATRDYLREQEMLSSPVDLNNVWTTSFLDASLVPAGQ